MSAERRPADALIAWLVVVTFLVVTALAGTYVWRMSRLADRARFQNAVQGTRAAVEYRLDAYINLLRASGGLFSLDRDPSSEELRQFIQHIDVQRRYPGIQGVGFSKRMTPAELPAVTAEIRKQHFADFRVWPDLPRGEYHAIVVIEPLSGTAIYSACAPKISVCNPNTLSPTLNDVTSLPIATTSPASSLPKI